MKTPRILIVLALALGLAGLAVAQEQSLGDVARKNRKSGASKVLTNEDMPKSGGGVSTVGEAPAPSSSGSASADSGASGSGAAATDPAAAPAGGEAGAAPAADAETKMMEERLKKLTYDEAGLERRITKMEAELEEAETEFRREMYRTGLENARKNLENIRGQKAETEKALADSKNKPAGDAAAAQQPASNPQ